MIRLKTIYRILDFGIVEEHRFTILLMLHIQRVLIVKELMLNIYRVFILVGGVFFIRSSLSLVCQRLAVMERRIYGFVHSPTDF
jgi:hypothetical protein